MKKRGRKGQVTIFIIIGILLVSSVLLFFLSRAGFIPQLGGGKPETSVNAFLNTCLEKEIKESIGLILKNGGYTESQLSTTFLFEDEEKPTEVSYLCYNQNDYLPCVNQEPVLLQNIKNEIRDYISDDVENCFNDMKKSFERQNFEVSGSGLKSFEVELKPRQVIMQTDSEITLTKSGEASTQKNFKVIIPTRLYELTNVVQEIINKETTTCNFEYRGYELLYPEFEIEKLRKIGSSSDIYTVEYLSSNEEFRFAIRGCVIPPGL